MSIVLNNGLKTLQWNLVFSEYLDPFPLYFVILENPVFCKVCYLICGSIYTPHPGIFYFTVRTYRQGNPQRSQQLFRNSRDLRKLEGSSSVWERQRSGMANAFPGRRGRFSDLWEAKRPGRSSTSLKLGPTFADCLLVYQTSFEEIENCLGCFSLGTSFFSLSSQQRTASGNIYLHHHSQEMAI